MSEKKEKSERGCGVRSDRNYTRITGPSKYYVTQEVGVFDVCDNV